MSRTRWYRFARRPRVSFRVAALAASFILVITAAAVFTTKYFTAPGLVAHVSGGSAGVTVNGTHVVSGKLVAGDRISTEAGSGITLAAGKGYTLAVGEKTTVVVKESSVQNGSLTLHLSLLSGTVSSTSDGTVHYRYETPQALITPVGTAFSVTTNESETIVAVALGMVNVAPSDGTAVVRIHQGQRCTVHLGSPVEISGIDEKVAAPLTPPSGSSAENNATHNNSEKSTPVLNKPAESVNTPDADVNTPSTERKSRQERIMENKEKRHQKD